MSNIDLTNPKVLKNFIASQIREGMGTISIRKEVKVFTDAAGNQFVVPEEIKEEVPSPKEVDPEEEVELPE